MRARRTSGPEACRAWRASHAMLWGRLLKTEQRNRRFNCSIRTPVNLEIFLENGIETQGMGTGERPEGPNGEVPRLLRSIRVFVEVLCQTFWAGTPKTVEEG